MRACFACSHQLEAHTQDERSETRLRIIGRGRKNSRSVLMLLILMLLILLLLFQLLPHSQLYLRHQISNVVLLTSSSPRLYATTCSISVRNMLMLPGSAK